MHITSHKEQKRLVKFAIVGMSGTIIDFTVFNLFIEVIKLQSIFASIISFTIAVINNFYWNRVWTYPESKEFSFSKQMVQFALISIIGLIIRTPLFAYTESIFLDILPNLMAGKYLIHTKTLSHNLSLAIAIIVVLFWNFFANRFWTYKDIK